MERGKSGSGRGGKNKAPQHPVDLFVLGAKASRGELSDTKRPGHPKASASHASLPGPERKRELPTSSSSGLPSKKPKLDSASSTHVPSSRVDSSSSSNADSWELVAIDCDPSDFVQSVARASEEDPAKAKALICGAIKLLKTQRAKPDKVLYLGLMYIATILPQLVTSEHVTQALCSLLRRDPTLSFKSKGNPTVPALAANLLFKAFQEYKHWPEAFIKVYVEDSIGERVWVDMEETKGFVDNIVTGFGTRPANRALLPADFLLGPGGRSDSPTISSATNTDDEAEGEGGQAGGTPSSSKLKLEAAPTMPRYRENQEEVEAVVMDAVKEQLSRRQPPESVSRNLLRLLASACGITEVRVAAAPRLELWLQNPKLMRATQELLLSVCANCINYTEKDIEVITHLIKMRLKTKAVLNLYLSGIKELIAAHPDNLRLVLKLTIYNELSNNARNPNNMAVVAVIFQAVPEQAAAVLAEVFQELLMKRDDYLRPLRALLREVSRVLRHDLPLVALCRGLSRERRDQEFRDFTPKERMMAAIADLISLCILLAVSPAVREAASLLARGDKREIQTLHNFRMLVAKIQRDAVYWLQETVPRMYHPAAPDFIHALHKVLFLESQDQYHGKDSWPNENERATMFRLATEVPVLQNTLTRLCIMGTSKEHPISCTDLLDLLDKIIKRAAAIQSEAPTILVEKTDLFELVFGLCTYRYPENITLPAGYYPPQLAISNQYWKSWIMLLIMAAHNPSSFGNVAWEKYPMLRALMEMCITNHFIFPPPTMALIEEDNKEAQIAALEKAQILEFETHLAAASTKVTITEQNSLLLAQLTSLDPTGPARRPPQTVLGLLQTLNEQLHLGHRLCRSRRPDFLLDVIQRQGTSQAMPWLADLVESSEGALSHLPVQCLCEFLLSDTNLDVVSPEGGTEVCQAQQSRQMKQQQLLTHLRSLLLDTSSTDAPAQCCEVLEYFLRRLGSAQAASRSQAIKGLKLLLSPTEDEEDDASGASSHSWLLQQLPALPHFALARSQAILALRQACQVENELSALKSYLQFLAKHAVIDPLPELADLVLDMAQLIVERNTIAQLILPSTEGEHNDPDSESTLHALMLIFFSYLQKAREPRKEAYTWSESQDQILVTWSSGEESTMHILVVHAMIILLTYGPGKDAELFNGLMETWVPQNKEPPKAFLVDTSEEALLIPDWLKLRMIQSSAPGLVDAALQDLEAPQLLLFAQSFGIPPGNMSKLLTTLDHAVDLDCETVRESVQDNKLYMLQLVQVQHYRGATGGQKFLALLQDPTLPAPHTSTSMAVVRPPMASIVPVPRIEVTQEQCPWLLASIFSANVAEAALAFSRLQRALVAEVHNFNQSSTPLFLLTTMIINLNTQVKLSPPLASVIVKTPHFSCPLFRLAITIKRNKCPPNLQSPLIELCQQIMLINQTSVLTDMIKTYLSKFSNHKSKLIKDDFSVLQDGQIESMFEATHAKQLVQIATMKLLDQQSSNASSSNTGLLLDWLSCLEPEMIRSCPEKQMQLLFAKAKGGAASCRPYLLTLLTHRTSWGTLFTCMTALLDHCNTSYDSAAVLDFLWALIGNPKLWQGREKRTPKHHTSEDILGLCTQQLCVLLDYVMEEAQCVSNTEQSGATNSSISRQREVLETRVPLILQCMIPEALQHVVRHLAPIMMARDGPHSLVSRQLLVQLYLCMPSLISHLSDTERDAFLTGASATSRSSCTLDVTSHCLLSALAAVPGQGKDWSRKAQDLELAARKMAATHPVLVLRQLPMLAASLRGRVHLESPVFRGRNHLLLFMQTLGLLELLQPHIFQPEHAQPLEDTLDSFFAMFQLHCHLKDVQTALARTVTLLQSFVSHDAQRALKYLQKHCQLLHDLQAAHPGLHGLQSLLAGLSLPARDGDEPELLVAAAMSNPADIQSQSASWAQGQVCQILARLGRHSQGEDVQGALQDLDHVTCRRPAVLESCVDILSSLLLSSAGGVRSLAHLLMLRYLRHSPTSAASSVSAYLRCLDNQNPDIQASALERLPEVIVCAQEHAQLLLERLFKMGVRSGVHTAPHISRAVALLQLQSGC